MSSHHAAPDQYQQKETADMAKHNTSTVPPVSLDEHRMLAEWYRWRAENASLDSREIYEEFAAQLTLRGGSPSPCGFVNVAKSRAARSSACGKQGTHRPRAKPGGLLSVFCPYCHTHHGTGHCHGNGVGRA